MFGIQYAFHCPTCQSSRACWPPASATPCPDAHAPTCLLSIPQVNIDHETRELTRTNLQTPTAMCFDVAQGKTRTLMEKDSYPRFLKSPAYRDLAAEAAAASASASPSEPSHT